MSIAKQIFDRTRIAISQLDRDDRFLTFQPRKEKIITIDLKEIRSIECDIKKQTIFMNDDLFVYFPELGLDIEFADYYAQLVGAWIKFKHRD